MRILVTGAFGFIGKHLCNWMVGHEVLKFGRDNYLKEVIDFQPNIIFHLAAKIQGTPTELFCTNILLTRGLLELSIGLKELKAFINVGSSSEYGRKNHRMKETDFLDPTTIYEGTKAAATLLCQSYARQYNLPIVTARPFTIYGPGEPETKLIPTLYNKMKSGETLDLSEGVHDFVYIDDFINGLLILAEQPKEKIKGDIVNFGTGQQICNLKVVQAFELVTNKKMKIHPVTKLRDYDSDCWVCDPLYTWKKYGWRWNTGLTSGIKAYVEYRKAQETSS